MKKIITIISLITGYGGMAYAGNGGDYMNPLYVYFTGASSTYTLSSLEVDNYIHAKGSGTIDGVIAVGTITTNGSQYWGKDNAKSTMTYAGALTLNGGMAGTTGSLSSTLGVSGAATLDDAIYMGPVNHKSTCAATTGNWTIHDAINVLGAATLDSTLDVDGNVVAGAANYRSTFTAASGALALTGSLTVNGGFSGDVKMGNANYVSTFTASNGTQVWTGALTAPTFNGAVVGGALSGTTGTFSGDVKMGAANYISTMTASDGTWAITGAVTTLGKVTAASLYPSSGAVGLVSKNKADIIATDPVTVGEMYYCADCTAVAVCVSTGTAAADWALITNKASACD